MLKYKGFEEAFIPPNGRLIGEIKEKPKTTFDIIKQNPAGTIVEFAELTGKSERTISRELKEYQDAGMISREGAKKNGYWVIL